MAVSSCARKPFQAQLLCGKKTTGKRDNRTVRASVHTTDSRHTLEPKGLVEKFVDKQECVKSTTVVAFQETTSWTISEPNVPSHFGSSSGTGVIASFLPTFMSDVHKSWEGYSCACFHDPGGECGRPDNTVLLSTNKLDGSRTLLDSRRFQHGAVHARTTTERLSMKNTLDEHSSGSRVQGEKGCRQRGGTHGIDPDQNREVCFGNRELHQRRQEVYGRRSPKGYAGWKRQRPHARSPSKRGCCENTRGRKPILESKSGHAASRDGAKKASGQKVMRQR